MLIGDVARRSGVSARMLRHYDSLGLVQPTGRTHAGYREYSSDDIRRIFHIESLRSLGLSLRDVGRALDDAAFAPSDLVDDLIQQTRERIAAETELLTRLRRIGAAEPADWEDVLQIVALLQALGSDSAGKRQRAALSSVDDVSVPVEALAEAALNEADPNVAGALRWALAQSGDGGLALLAEGLGSPAAEVRKRAVRSIAEIPDAAATALLQDALAADDIVVRRYAALALGNRGIADAVPTLIDMIVEDVNDADAADALSVVASDPVLADQIATRLSECLAEGSFSPADGSFSPADGSRSPADGSRSPADGSFSPAGGSVSATRLRLTQALGDVPGPTSARALAELSHDDDRAVALTATSILTARNVLAESSLATKRS